MSELAERLKTELTALDVSERAAIAHFVIHSLDDESDANVEDAWDAELERRQEVIESGVAVGEPADEVFAALRRKYS